MMTLLFLILIIYGIVWLVKTNNTSPKNNKETLLYLIQEIKEEFNEEIRQLKYRIFTLESEIKKLNHISDNQEEPIKEEIIQEETVEIIKEAEKPYEPIFNELYEEKKEIENEEPILSKTDKQAREKSEIETFITANLFNKIGALALILGMGFFLKYAFDENWINPLIQILTGYLVAAGLIYGANHFFKQDHYKSFSQGLAGAGIAVSYLSTFASSNFYHLIDYRFALVLMSGSTILAFKQALKYDSVAVALLGLTGGFITPFLLYSGGGNIVGLLTYLIFLNGWIIALLVKKENWKSLEFISIFTTYFIFFTTNPTITNNAMLSFIFLFSIWMGYTGLDLFRVSKGNNTRIYSNILNGIMFYAGMNTICSHNSIAIITFIISLIYFALGLITYKKFNKPENYLKQNIIASILLLVIATNIEYTGFSKIIMWSIEAFAILWLGLKYQKNYVYKTATYLFSISMITLLFNKQALGFIELNNYTPLLNLRTMTYLILISLLAISSKLLNKTENTKLLKEYYNYCWCTLLFIIFSVEVNDFMTKLAFNSINNTANLINFNKSMIQVIVWMSYSLQLLRAGFNKTTKSFIYSGFAGISIAVLQLLITGLTFTPIESFLPLINMRFVAFCLTALSLMYTSNIIKKYEQNYSWAKGIKNICTYLWCLLIFILLNCEISDFFTKKTNLTGGITQSILFSKNMLLAIVWSLYSIPLIKKGIKKKNTPLIICGSFSIILALSAGIFYGFSFVPIENYTIFFNERMFMFSILIITLICITKWLKQNSQDNLIYPYIKLIQITLSLLIFFILTIEVKDLFAKEIFLLTNNSSIATDSGKLNLFNNLKQLVISGVWLMYSIGLMIWGILHKIKPVWYIALSILGITVLKVFIIDLSFLSQLYRVISYIGLGVIMLLLSYFYQKYSQQISCLLRAENK
ncbi:MAG: DUF2339 domain-containing protein [bacterium]